MILTEDIAVVENTIGYLFKRKALLAMALTAAGADNGNYQGNRRLAQIGIDAIGICLSFEGFEKWTSPSKDHQNRYALLCT